MNLADHKYIPGHGPMGAKLVILGEAPSTQELAAGLPFVGPSGKELDRLLADSGIKRANCWVTNVSKYFVPPLTGKRKIPFGVRANTMYGEGFIEEQISNLQKELNAIRPNCILALGGTALWALTGKTKITNFRGSILLGMGYKTVSTYHPAHLLHTDSGEFKGYWNRQLMVQDFKRALYQSGFSDIILPKRHLSICKSSAQLAEFISRYKGHIRPSIDIEANGTCIPVCIGIAFTPHEGITIPLWNYDDISDIHKSELVQMWILLADFLANHDVIGQNFKYDQDKIRRLGFVIRRLASDTMLKGFTIHPELPKRLAFFQSIYTEEPFYKDEGMYEGSIHDLFIGCARDACVTKEIDLAMDSDIDSLEQREYFENFVMHLHSFYLGIENEGFYIDPEKRDFLFRKYVKWSEELAHELFQLTGEYTNANSPKQVGILLFEVLKCPFRPGTGEEELTSLLNLQSFADPKKRRIVEIILEKRRVDKTIGTYLAAIPDYDGKMKTTYFPCLETGRSRTAQLEPPIRPSLELKDENNKKKKKAIGCAFQTITKHGDIGQDIRSQYIPEKGYVFLQADSSQAEARVVFLLAEDYQALKDIDEHDYHALTASWFFGKTEEDYSKIILGYEHPIRFAGKTLRHAGHLGAGKRRAATSVNTDARKYHVDIRITEAIADRALKIFHAKQPNIRGVFHNGIVSKLESNRVLTAGLPYGINARIGGRRTFFERWGEELNRTAFSYIPQRTISDNTKAAGLRLKKRIKGLRVILEAHDSLLFMVRERDSEDFAPIIKEEFERPIRFENCTLSRPDLSIPCEIEIGYNYQELKKFKFMVELVQNREFKVG